MSKKYPIMHGYTPLNYSQINNIEGHLQPSMMKYCNSITYAYWQRSLFQRAISTIDFTGLPEEWEGSVRDFFYWCIFAYGYVGVFKPNDELGLVFQPGNLKGFDFYYQPVEFIVANPKLKGMTGTYKIHEDCEIIKLTPDWRGIWDIICYYSMLLSLLDSGITGSITGTKFSYLLGAKNKSAAETIKAIFQRIFSGEPAVVYDNNLLPNDPNSKDEPFQFIERSNLKSSYLVTDQLMDRSTLLSSFDAEIGIRSLPYNKKERLVTAEAESREQDSTARLMVWKKTLDSSIDLVNKMFDLNIKAELSYDKGVSDNEDDIDRNGIIPES